MSAIDLWKEKREFLEKELAKTSDSAQKFSILKQIEEAKEKIAELTGEKLTGQEPTQDPTSSQNSQTMTQ